MTSQQIVNLLKLVGTPRDGALLFRKRIEVAEKKGDKQAAREMAVFARRLEKAIASRRGPAA
jgi:hypothetical protein